MTGVQTCALPIFSLVLFWIPFVGTICGVLGIIFGWMGMQRANKGATGRGMAVAGLVTGIIGTLVGLWWIFAIVEFGRHVSEITVFPTFNP